MSCGSFFCDDEKLCTLCACKESTKLILDNLVPYFEKKGDVESVKVLKEYFDVSNEELKYLYKFYKIFPEYIKCNWDRGSYDLWNKCTSIRYSNTNRYFINKIKYCSPYICKKCNNGVKEENSICSECKQKYGFDKNGFNQQGIHKNGTYYNEFGFDKNGFNRGGYDKDGYNKYGFDINGFDRQGYNENGEYRDKKLNSKSIYSTDYEEEIYDIDDFMTENGYDCVNDTIEDMYNID